MTKVEIMEMMKVNGLVADMKELKEANYVMIAPMVFGNGNQFIQYEMNNIFFEHHELGELTVKEAIAKGYSFYLVEEENIKERQPVTRSVYSGYYGCDEVIKDTIISLKEESKKISLYRREVKVGLIMGRHEMPVEDYLFREIANVLDFESMEAKVEKWIRKNIHFKYTYGGHPSQVDYTDVKMITSVERLVVYITGLTSVTAALIKICSAMGVKLTLMHYDREEDRYLPQIIF